MCRELLGPELNEQLTEQELWFRTTKYGTVDYYGTLKIMEVAGPVPLKDRKLGFIEDMSLRTDKDTLFGFIQSWEAAHSVNIRHLKPVVDLIPDNFLIKPVLSFLFYTDAYSSIGCRQDELPVDLDGLRAEVDRVYSATSGARPASLIHKLLDKWRYPDEEDQPITLSRYFGRESHSEWKYSLEYGLRNGFFVIEEDGDTVNLHPQIVELFFPEFVPQLVENRNESV